MSKIQQPYYPIVYVRGYAMTPAEREATFYDTYYGFSANSVEKRQAPPPEYFQADVFEGQLIRFMKIRDFGYADASNHGEVYHPNPSRSIWICRFYDQDYMKEKLRSIEAHAEELRRMVCETIPARLEAAGVDLGRGRKDYKVILIAHSMGGLVCRTLIQNLLPAQKEDPKEWIHRLVTVGTPHRGIDLGKIPDFLENFVAKHLNPFDANIFQEKRMRDYLKLPSNYDVHSLGALGASYSFPAKRCLCLIGSDYQSYNVVEKLTGNFSDGLVKQDRAYIVAGPKPKGRYPEERCAHWANLHRAHSGRRGLVNSFESYENIHRFLFGDIKAEIALEEIAINGEVDKEKRYFYDFEFSLSIRGTNTYLHRRQQHPCENAIRLNRSDVPPRLLLHTAFLNSNLKVDPGDYSHFSLALRVVEHAVKPGFLWDHEYPDRQIYNEMLEIRVGDFQPDVEGTEVQYRWLSEAGQWHDADGQDNVYRIRLREAGSLSGTLAIKAVVWPDETVRDRR